MSDAVPTARQFEPALAALGQAMPSDISSREGLMAYRRAAQSRGTTAAAIEARCGLTAHERVVCDLEVTVFRPPGPAVARAVFLHGGGLIAGNRFDGVDVVARHAARLGLEVWTIEYPLAPEARFGQAVESVLRVAAAAGDDGMRVLLAGQSAGGGIAAEVALRAAHGDVRIDGQLLVCPMLARVDERDAGAFRSDRSWSASQNTSAWSEALGEGSDVPPGERRELPALGPSYLDAGSAELFRDSITTFATALWRRGNRAELHVWSGGFHGFDCAAEDAAASAESHRVRGEWIRRWLADEL